MLDILLNIVLAINGLILDPSGTHLGLFLNMLLSLLFDFHCISSAFRRLTLHRKAMESIETELKSNEKQ